MTRQLCRSLCCFLTLATAVFSAEPEFLNDSKRILFLGDSITHAGQYISIIEAELRLQSDQPIPELVNLGLPSETASGLSEPSHPFPRPNVHERLDRALSKLKPDVVVACYGMNDGIYYPFSEKRFEIYQRGINKLIDKVKSGGAKLVLMTPPPFDPLPLRKKGKLRAAGEEEYAWHSIYEDYDDVLKRYAEWVKQQSDRVEMVIDLHSPVNEYIQTKREEDPDFVMSGDGVHVNREGHQIIAHTILRAWDFEPSGIEDKDLSKLVHQRQSVMHNAYLTHVGHKRPGMKDGLPINEAKKKASELDKQINNRLVRVRPLLNSTGPGSYHHVHLPASKKAGELAVAVDYYLWIPPGVEKLDGIIVHQHGCGDGAAKGGATAANDLHWQALAAKWNCGLLGPSIAWQDGMDCRIWCDPRNGSADRFLQAMNHFAQSTEHAEIESIPWCLWGHSGGGFWASLMQTLYPERIVGIWLQSGTAYDRWESGEIPKVELQSEVFEVPVVACPGFKEKTHERFHVAWEGGLSMFHAYRAKGAPFVFAPDPRTGHECGDSRYLAIPFFDECLRLRLPENPVSEPLKSIKLKDGWLAALDGEGVETFSSYEGDQPSAVWLPSEEFAAKWQEFIKTGAVSDSTPPPAPTDLRITKSEDGTAHLSWQAKADFESGISGFRIEQDGKVIAEIPKKPSPRFGRPLFQRMSYHDTPEQPLREMKISLPEKMSSSQPITVRVINSVGKKSKPVSVTLKPSAH